MKILLISDLNSIHTKKWVKSLAAEGIIVAVFGLTPAQDDFYEKLENVEIGSAQIAVSNQRSFVSKLSYLKQIRRLKRFYRSFKPDIVHAHYASSYGLLGSFLNHKPYLISMWGTEIFEFPKTSWVNRFILKRNFRKADYLFSTSHAMADEAHLYTQKTIEVVPFGVDLALFKPLSKPENGEIVIGIVKTLELNYGINFLIDAFRLLVNQLPDQQLKLIIAGSGSQETNLKKQVNELNLETFVEFTGYIQNDKVVACFNRFDIAVVASLEESFGVSAVEASACEKPVVATRVGGLVEVVLDHETGLLVDPANPSDLAEKLKLLVENPLLRKEMGQKGREHVLKNYDWNSNVSLMIHHYKRIFEINN